MQSGLFALGGLRVSGCDSSSGGEIWVIVGTVLGAVVGGGFALITQSSAQKATQRQRLREAYSAWLGARTTFVNSTLMLTRLQQTSSRLVVGDEDYNRFRQLVDAEIENNIKARDTSLAKYYELMMLESDQEYSQRIRKVQERELWEEKGDPVLHEKLAKEARSTLRDLAGVLLQDSRFKETKLDQTIDS